MPNRKATHRSTLTPPSPLKGEGQSEKTRSPLKCEGRGERTPSPQNGEGPCPRSPSPQNGEGLCPRSPSPPEGEGRGEGTTREHHLLSRSPEETRRIAETLARSLPARATLALHGELGSGKTCFVGGLAAALGVRRAVTSPTFTVIHEYRGAQPLYHIDLYRIRGPDEALAMGLEEYLEADGLKAVEWAEKAADLLPADTVHVFFRPGPGETDRDIAIRRP